MKWIVAAFILMVVGMFIETQLFWLGFALLALAEMFWAIDLVRGDRHVR